MTARGDPATTARGFAAAMNAGDLAGACAYWVEDGVMIALDGTEVRGKQDIADRLAALIDAGAHMEIELLRVIEAADTAAAAARLTVRVPGTGGEPVEHRTETAVVYRRGFDGWRIAIDAIGGVMPERLRSAP